MTVHAPDLAPAPARDWVKILANYREPNNLRSSVELFITIVPFVAIWVFACWVAQFSYLAAIGLSMINSLFIMRLFCIQHDCGHGSFLTNRTASDWVGRVIGIITMTPYDVWRRTHSIHHSHSGDLAHRGIGDIMTLTTEEYNARTPLGRWLYRLYRHPITMFVVGPTYIFFIQNRLPVGLMNQGRKYWISAMATNVAIVLALSAIFYFGGWTALVFVFLPSSVLAASIGVWMFYVQHQFETTHWDREEDWQLHEAALHGSSHYDLPLVLRWFSANIGIHHVHHLYARIPFYRLPEILRDHKELVHCNRMTLLQSIRCASLDLWDAKNRRLISFATAHNMAPAQAV
jgi:omega-6 fatty acid desaturase (delta-12 desaturase)